MCLKPPKAPKPKDPPPPIEAPDIQLGSDNPNQDIRQRSRRGRDALRTGLAVGDGPTGTGLTIN